MNTLFGITSTEKVVEKTPPKSYYDHSTSASNQLKYICTYEIFCILGYSVAAGGLD